MSDHAVARWTVAVAEALDEASFTLKQGGDKPKVARALRRLADILEQRI